MTRTRILIATVLAVASLVVSAPAQAATNMGGGVTCYGNPTYGTNPRISCSRTSSRYAAWVDRFWTSPGRCDFYVVYGSAWVWAGGGITKSASSFTFAYNGYC